MDKPLRDRRARGRRLLLFATPLVGLAVVLSLLVAGVAPGRLRPVAVFLTIAAVASIVMRAVTRLSARRARQLRGADVPWGVRLAKPMWLSAPEASVAIQLGGLLAALVGLAGCPGIGAGVLFTFGIIGLAFPLMQSGMSARALTFEAGGLRVDTSRAAFVIPWASITAVETVGPDHMQFTTVRISDPESIVATATPDTPRTRANVESCLRDTTAGRGQLLLMHWTAGLDGTTLKRALDAARSGAVRAVN